MQLNLPRQHARAPSLQHPPLTLLVPSRRFATSRDTSPAVVMATTTPTAAELADYSLCGQKLWDLDDNRLKNVTEYDINVGGGKKSYDTHDAAAGALFAMVSKDVWTRPTFKKFYDLLDNYETGTGVAEVETVQEKKEINDFLDAICSTRPMQYTHNYLVAKGLTTANKADFKRMLYQMWFSFYRRETANDSCGFEHVFVGESDNAEVSGFHNWIHFWIQEKKGTVDYKGFIKPRNRGEVVDDNDRVLSIQFAWNGETKNVTTLFIGTSPEFEFALYSLYFLVGSERNNVVIDGYEICLRCYRIRSKYGDKVGSAFPELMAEHSNHHQ